MNSLENFKLLGIALLLAGGLAACDNPGPAESAGKKLDDAANRAGEKIEDAVDKVGEKLDEKSEKAGIALDDAEITTKVKGAIYSEPGLKTLRISVDTIKGVVTLTGSVNSQAAFDRTSALAESVGGVQEVANHLQVKPPY
jgi:hyperosmotically inducible periplasmic protein